MTLHFITSGCDFTRSVCPSSGVVINCAARSHLSPEDLLISDIMIYTLKPSKLRTITFLVAIVMNTMPRLSLSLIGGLCRVSLSSLLSLPDSVETPTPDLLVEAGLVRKSAFHPSWMGSPSERVVPI